MRLALMACLALSLAAESPLLVKAARLLDVRTGKIQSPGQVLVQGNRVVAGPVPRDARVLDLGDRTILPGLIDAHTHLMFPAGLTELQHLKLSRAEMVIAGVVNARTVLEAGFTTVRDLGSNSQFGEVALRDAIAAGTVPGPRMLVSGPALSITGGHGDLNGYPCHLHVERENIVDSPEEAVARVREWKKRGVDLIKIHATGGVLSNHDDPAAASFSPEEFKAIVEEAGRRGMDVAAHAHGDAGILEATRAGVRSLEHCSLASASTAREMKSRGAWMVPTLYALECIIVPGNPGRFPAGSVEKAKVIQPRREAAFRQAVALGVPVAYGTDIGVFDHARAAADFRYLVAYGLSPLQAIQAATLNAAGLLRLESEVGTLEPGRSADLIAVEGNPLEDITVLEKVAFVMARGKVMKGAGR
ncbi:MAG: amidohydrolase family protein [Acidobacteria bacterium]|nr:amidohydrolase family protein [Acidobacteriota bacterium]